MEENKKPAPKASQPQMLLPVKQIEVAVGVQIRNQVRNGIDAEALHLTMEMWPMGVRITSPKTAQFASVNLLVPFANIKQITFKDL